MINVSWKIDLDEFKNIQNKVCYSANTYPELIDVVGNFTIEINKKIFFKEPHFPILELVRTLEKWKEEKNMLYNCIETEDNPLISFIYNNGGYIIKSPWQIFECKELFAKEELITEIKALMISVEEQFKLI